MDNNELSTNLAEVGTDCISRQQAIDALKELTANGTNKGMVFGKDAVHRIEMLPSAQPEIIRCRDCKHLSNDRITPEFNRVCRLYGCGKKEYGFCDEGERRTDE